MVRSVEREARPVPMTRERAATALIQARAHVGRVRDELMLAVEILGRLRPGNPAAELTDALARLEEAEVMIRRNRA